MAGMFCVPSSCQIQRAPERFRSSAGAAIHFAVQSALVRSAVSSCAGALYSLGLPVSSQTRTFQRYCVADSSAGPPYGTFADAGERTSPLSQTVASPLVTTTW